MTTTAIPNLRATTHDVAEVPSRRREEPLVRFDDVYRPEVERQASDRAHRGDTPGTDTGDDRRSRPETNGQEAGATRAGLDRDATNRTSGPVRDDDRTEGDTESPDRSDGTREAAAEPAGAEPQAGPAAALQIDLRVAPTAAATDARIAAPIEGAAAVDERPAGPTAGPIAAAPVDTSSSPVSPEPIVGADAAPDLTAAARPETPSDRTSSGPVVPTTPPPTIPVGVVGAPEEGPTEPPGDASASTVQPAAPVETPDAPADAHAPDPNGSTIGEATGEATGEPTTLEAGDGGTSSSEAPADPAAPPADELAGSGADPATAANPDLRPDAATGPVRPATAASRGRPPAAVDDAGAAVVHSAERRAAAHAQANETLARAELRRLTHGGSRLELATDAGELGTIRIEATDGGSGLHLQLGSDRSATRAMLGEHLHELRSQLQAGGFDLGSLDVGGGSGRDGDERSTAGTTPASPGPEHVPAPAVRTAVPHVLERDRVDLRL